jgi:hypothetical protein
VATSRRIVIGAAVLMLGLVAWQVARLGGRGAYAKPTDTAEIWDQGRLGSGTFH